MGKRVSKEVREKIVSDYLSGEYSYEELGKKYVISDSTVWKVLNRSGMCCGVRVGLRYEGLVEDIRNGLSYWDLMDKYVVDRQGLNRMLRILRGVCCDEKVMYKLMFELNGKRVGRSGYRGVREKSGRFYAVIWDSEEGRQVCIGGYESGEEAFSDRIEWEMSVVRLRLGES